MSPMLTSHYYFKNVIISSNQRHCCVIHGGPVTTVLETEKYTATAAAIKSLIICFNV